MRRVFQYDGEVFGILSKGYSYLVLNLCFLIGCLPIVTIGVSTVAAYNVALDSIEGRISRLSSLSSNTLKFILD